MEQDYEYRLRFYTCGRSLELQAPDARFEGIDTVADLFLNGSPCLGTYREYAPHDLNLK